MPKKISHKIIWSTGILSLGLIVAFSRVGVGAHYPFDVIIGSIIGYIVTIIGIIISNKLKRFSWSKNHKAYYIFLMIILPIWMFLIVEKILKNNLFIFYLAIISLIFTLYIAIRLYVIKKN